MNYFKIIIFKSQQTYHTLWLWLDDYVKKFILSVHNSFSLKLLCGSNKELFRFNVFTPVVVVYLNTLYVYRSSTSLSTCLIVISNLHLCVKSRERLLQKTIKSCFDLMCLSVVIVNWSTLYIYRSSTSLSTCLIIISNLYLYVKAPTKILRKNNKKLFRFQKLRI